MKLVIEEARDHMECLDQVRKTHGTDCLIVHSFKQPDSYCIIVAIESADVKTGAQLVSSVVGATVPQASPLPSKVGVSDAAEPTVYAKTLAEGDSQEHTTPEISPSILELARKLGIAKSTIYRWRADGWGIDDLFDDGWDVEEVREWSKDMKRARRAVLRPPLDASLDEGEEDSRDYGALYRKFKALKEGLNLRQLQGSLVEKAEVETMMAMRISELTTALDSLAAQLAPRLAPLPRESEIQGVLRSAFHELRDHFARGSGG